MKKAKRYSPHGHAKKVSKKKTIPKSTGLENASFFKRKMAKGDKMPAIAGLPK